MGHSPGGRLVYLWEPGTDLGSSLIFTGHTRTSFTNSTSEFSTQLTASRTFRPFGPLSPNICLKTWLPVTATRFAMINSIIDTIFVTVSLAISNTATATNRTLVPDINRVHFSTLSCARKPRTVRGSQTMIESVIKNDSLR